MLTTRLSLRKLIVAGAVFVAGSGLYSAAAMAGTSVSTLAYGAYFDFDSKSPKSTGYLYGAYASLFTNLTHLVEFGYDRTRLDFDDLGTLDQNDYTLKYTYYIMPGMT